MDSAITTDNDDAHHVASDAERTQSSNDVRRTVCLDRCMYHFILQYFQGATRSLLDRVTMGRFSSISLTRMLLSVRL